VGQEIEEKHWRLPLALTGFSIRNFQGIEQLDLPQIPLNTQWIFLTGYNGFGKTSVLRAILLGLVGKEHFTGKTIDENSRIVLTMKQQHYAFTFIPPTDLKTVHFSVFGNHLHTPIPRWIAAYGANRTFLNPTDQAVPLTSSLFFDGKTEGLYVLNTEVFLEKLNGTPELEPLKQKIIDAFLFLIPNLYKIDIVPNANQNGVEVWYYEKDEWDNELAPVRFNELAMGMRGIIGLVGDIIQRLSEERDFVQENKKRPHKNAFRAFDELYGIVIIDELDNHLHPQWQRDLVDKLTTLFPKVQFIVSTHSPVPLLGAPTDRTVILNVNRSKEQGITIKRLERIETELPNLLPNVLLTSPAFGMDELKSVDNLHAEHVVVDEHDKDRQEDKQLDQEMDELFEQHNWGADPLFTDEV